MTETEHLRLLLHCWMQAYEEQRKELNELRKLVKPAKMRKATRQEKIVNPGVYEVEDENSDD